MYPLATMLTRADITNGISLRLNTTHLGHRVGLIGMVYALGTDQAGQWYFQLRYVNAPPGSRTRAYTMQMWGEQQGEEYATILHKALTAIEQDPLIGKAIYRPTVM